MSRRWFLATLLLAGCAAGENSPEYQFDLQLGNEYYKNGKFEEAIRKYEDAIEKNPNGYEAIVGLACADREWGFRKFVEAEDLHRARKPELAEREFKKAVNVHDSAQRLFIKAIQLRPDDLLAHRELGYFFYKRATSPYSYPYRLDDKVNRQRERDLAIEKFTQIVEKVPNEYFAQRYLGLALFARGESPKGRVHLERYLWGMATARNYILKTAPRTTPEQREDTEKRLREIDKELNEVRDMLMGYASDLSQRRKMAAAMLKDLEERRENERDPKELEGMDRAIADTRSGVEKLTVEILAVEALITRYKEVEATKVSQERQ